MAQPFDFREFLSLAYWLFDPQQPSVSEHCVLRAVVGRAYYAAFKYAHEFLLADGSCARISEIHLTGEKTPAHVMVINHFLEDGRSRREKRIGNRLDSLKKDRAKCDYDSSVKMFPEFSRTTVEKNLMDAAEVIKDIDELKASATTP